MIRPPLDSRAKAALNRKRRRRKIRAIELLGGSCRDCGETFPGRPEVLEFDHLYNKTHSLGRMFGGSPWSAILVELKKCELVCSNCHLTRTQERRSFGCTLQPK